MNTDEVTNDQISRQFGTDWKRQSKHSLAYMGLRMIADFNHAEGCQLSSVPIHECICRDISEDGIAAITLAAMARTEVAQ
jgi:hypothetical protein